MGARIHFTHFWGPLVVKCGEKRKSLTFPLFFLCLHVVTLVYGAHDTCIEGGIVLQIFKVYNKDGC